MAGRLAIMSIAALAVSLATVLQAAEGGEAPTASGASIKKTSADDAERDTPPPRPIADSIARAVADAIANDPTCQAARAENVPCFPSSVEVKGQTLQKALERFRGPSGSVGEGPPGPSAADEERLRNPQQAPLPVVGGVSFDPVCAGKSLWRQIKGKKGTFWVYRVRDRIGETVVLRDAPLEAQQEAEGGLRAFELLGKYDGECAALAAYRNALRTLRWEQEKAREAREP
jgi:hypothetical protein